MQKVLFFQPAFLQKEPIPIPLLLQKPGFSIPHLPAPTIRLTTVIPILTQQSTLLAALTIIRLPKAMDITSRMEATTVIMGI